MLTLLAVHEVNDVDRWLSSPKRDEFFAAKGMTVRAFRDAGGSNRVGLVVEVPDMATWEQAMQSAEAAEAMQHDGVRPQTLVIMQEG